MSPSDADPTIEIETADAPEVAVPARNWTRYITIGIFGIGALLLLLGWWGLRYVDGVEELSAAAKRGSAENIARLQAEKRQLPAQERLAEGELTRANIALETAKEKLRLARRTNQPPDVLRKLYLEHQVAAAEQVNRQTDLASRILATQAKEKELDAAKSDARRSAKKPLLTSAFSSSPSAQSLALKTARLGSHSFAVIGILGLIAGFFVAAIPWVKQRAAALLEDLVKGAVSSSAPASGISGAGSAGLGQFALQAATASAVVAVTVGAFSLTIPGRSIDVALDDKYSATASVDAGAFDIRIPGKQFQVAPERVVLRNGEARVDMPELTVQLPPIQLPTDPTLAGFAAELRQYREYLQSAQRANDENSELRQMNQQLVAQYSGLVDELRTHPTKAEFDTLKANVEQQKTASANLAAAMTDLKEATNEQRKGSYLSALELARTINLQNDRVFNTMFRQTLIKQNCATYEWLHAKFPDVIAPDGCIQRRRLDPILNPGYHAPDAFKPVPATEVGRPPSNAVSVASTKP